MMFLSHSKRSVFFPDTVYNLIRRENFANFVFLRKFDSWKAKTIVKWNRLISFQFVNVQFAIINPTACKLRTFLESVFWRSRKGHNSSFLPPRDEIETWEPGGIRNKSANQTQQSWQNSGEIFELGETFSTKSFCSRKSISRFFCS